MTGTFLDIFESRWHGFARWEMSVLIPIQGKPGIIEKRLLARGWARKHRGKPFERWRLEADSMSRVPVRPPRPRSRHG